MPVLFIKSFTVQQKLVLIWMILQWAQTWSDATFCSGIAACLDIMINTVYVYMYSLFFFSKRKKKVFKTSFILKIQCHINVSVILKVFIHLIVFLPYFTRQTTLWLTQKKNPTKNKKNLLWTGANSFILEWAPFQKGAKKFDTVVSLESLSVSLKLKAFKRARPWDLEYYIELFIIL